jgi:hypothetical protein
VWLLEGHTQVAVVGDDKQAGALYAAAVAPFALNKAVLRLRDSAEVHNLPPALAETVPHFSPAAGLHRPNIAWAGV